MTQHSQRAKIAIVHPRLGWGGSEAVALWAIEALKTDYNLSLITNGEVRISDLNAFYGTELTSLDFTTLQAPLPPVLRNTAKFAALRGRFIQRYSQRIASSFDLMISSYNPLVFGVKGIQLVADLEELSSILPLNNWRKLWYGHSLIRASYLRLCNWVSPIDPTHWKDNITFANSNWTADLIRHTYGTDAGVLYPPVLESLSNTSYEERELGFVCLGRVIPEKQIETIIEILEMVRMKGHDVHLHVVGAEEKGNSYSQMLRSMCLERNFDWVSFEGILDERRKNDLISSHRFGMSGRKGEPFGIAVAEMVKAGCIVYVPDNGGQVEIVNHPDLVYQNTQDAAEKIDVMLKESSIQKSLLDHLSIASQNFSVANFKTGMQKAVANFFQVTPE